MPLGGGLDGFEALRCYAEERAFSLSTQAQDHVWDFIEYKRVKPAHCPTGATSGGTHTRLRAKSFVGIPPSLFAHAPCLLHDWGVRTSELDLTSSWMYLRFLWGLVRSRVAAMRV